MTVRLAGLWQNDFADRDGKLRATGIEAVYFTSGGNTSTSSPLYDCHGNIIASLSKSGSSYWTAPFLEDISRGGPRL